MPPSVDEIVAGLNAQKAAQAARCKPKDDKALRDAFYNSRAWRAARYQALKAAKGRCQACGASAADGVKLCVDHIKPVRHFWHLRLEPTNLQVLCNDCNLAKASKDMTDWRRSEKLGERG